MIFSPTFKYGIVLLFCLHAFNPALGQTNEQEIKVELRSIGNAFLESMGDTTSRILPIEKIAGRYAVQFEREFIFQPLLLIDATFEILEQSSLGFGYIVEVETCEKGELMHSFRASLDQNDKSIACETRDVPPACYIFYFTVIESALDFQNTAFLKEQETVTNEKMEDHLLTKFVLGFVGCVFLLGAIWFFKRRRIQPALPNDYIMIGEFQYDQKGMKLVLAEKTIELSSKESDLLYLLYTNVNETVKREEILLKIWGDEGDYVGRTLDVFISKLRKKLEADANLKIVNIRGVGYRLVFSD